jgi:hypothetical protein
MKGNRIELMGIKINMGRKTGNKGRKERNEGRTEGRRDKKKREMKR